jgi:hypothetical protein
MQKEPSNSPEQKPILKKKVETKPSVTEIVY